ncbi:MAG: hypothetical protein R2706_01935 [Acidimicrobiales bacterium]
MELLTTRHYEATPRLLSLCTTRSSPKRPLHQIIVLLQEGVVLDKPASGITIEELNSLYVSGPTSQ